jgi:hypothetical protein
LAWKLLKKQAFYWQLKAFLSVIKVANSGIIFGFYDCSKQGRKNCKLVIKKAVNRPLKRVRENNKKQRFHARYRAPNFTSYPTI